jgi:hydrogenase nickel incorporation protein HypA/HybF
MHELPVVENILSTVLISAKTNSGKKVAQINLVVGDLSSIVDDSLQYYFDLLSKNTLAESAKLSIKRVPAIAVCADCNSKIPATLPLSGSCRKCHSQNIHIDGGLEFFIDSIEII